MHLVGSYYANLSRCAVHIMSSDKYMPIYDIMSLPPGRPTCDIYPVLAELSVLSNLNTGQVFILVITIITLHVMIKYTYFLLLGPGWLSRYSDSLRVGLSWNQIPVRVRLFCPSRQALGPTQPPVQWIPGLFLPRVKRPVRCADHTPHIAPRLKKE